MIKLNRNSPPAIQSTTNTSSNNFNLVEASKDGGPSTHGPKKDDKLMDVLSASPQKVHALSKALPNGTVENPNAH